MQETPGVVVLAGGAARPAPGVRSAGDAAHE